MNQIETDIVIIGAGLSGCAIAHFLHKNKIDFCLVEARGRLGGRICTTTEHCPIDLGATWFGQQHKSLQNLMDELGVSSFEQYFGETAIYEAISTSRAQLVRLPEQEQPSFRIKGGTYELIKKLTENLPSSSIHTSQVVKKISKQENRLCADTTSHQFFGNKIVVTLPPALFIGKIQVEPALPNSFIEISSQTQTWMANSIKFGLSYSAPFWNKEQTSGTLVSNVGPVTEMYDHSNYERSQFSLMGFLNGTYSAVSKNERLRIILSQLFKYYGNDIHSYTKYKELVWSHEEFTAPSSSSNLLPHQNNGDDLFHKSYLDNQLYFAGTETNPHFPGYMEGAIQSAESILKKLKVAI